MEFANGERNYAFAVRRTKRREVCLFQATNGSDYSTSRTGARIGSGASPPAIRRRFQLFRIFRPLLKLNKFYVQFGRKEINDAYFFPVELVKTLADLVL